MAIVSISLETREKLTFIAKHDRRTLGLSILFMCDQRISEISQTDSKFMSVAKKTNENFISQYKKSEDKNSAVLFLDEAICEDPTYKTITTCEKLYDVYVQWCRQHGYYFLNNVHFGKTISKLFPTKRSKRIHINDNKKRVYIGINYKNNFVFPENNTEIIENKSDEFEEYLEEDDDMGGEEIISTEDITPNAQAANNKAINDAVIAEAEVLRAKKLAEKAQ